MANEVVQGLQLVVSLRGVITGSDGARQVVDLSYERNFTDGEANDGLEIGYVDQAHSVTGSEDVDVRGSASYTDFKGQTLDTTAVRLVWIENKDTDSADYCKVSMPAANGVPDIFLAAGDGLKVHPRGLFLWVAPGPDDADVTAGTGDLINLNKNSNNVSIDLAIFGTN